MRRRRAIDPVARSTLLAIAAGRIAIGVGAVLATRPALRLLGFPQAGPAATALGKLAGGRDIALGALALLGRDDLQTLRTTALASAAVDAADALSLGLAGMQEDGLGRAGALGALSGGAAALGGAWAAGRL